MNIVESQMPIANYCVALERKEVIVNPEYQRSDKVWPPVARSFLIETILLGYPVPKFFLYQKTDIRSKKTYKEIVDGQQRSKAIKDFYDDKLRLSGKLDASELAGKIYSELSDEYKGNFLNYSLSIDLFVAISPEEIREVFRRMNSYTVPLNPEERRHAIYQGQFKWFVYSLSKRIDESLLMMGIFKEKNLIRMADAKLFTEIAHALLFDIQTTDAKKLDKLYYDKDDSFPEQEILSQRITQAFDILLSWPDLHNTAIMKPFSVYSLVLAITHIQNPLPNFQAHYPIDTAGIRIEQSQILANLSQLASALEEPESSPVSLREYIDSSTSKTNVAKERLTRFKWYCRAIQNELPS